MFSVLIRISLCHSFTGVDLFDAWASARDQRLLLRRSDDPSQSPTPTLDVRACILLFFSETSRRRSAGHQQGSRAVAWGGHCCDKVMRSCSQLAYFPCQSSPRRSVQSVGQLYVFFFTSVLVELQNSVFECSTMWIRESLTNETLRIRRYVLGVGIQNKVGHLIMD